MRYFLLSAIAVLFTFSSFSQAANPANDTLAASLLRKVSEKYETYKNISADFKLIVQRPKLKAEESDRKYTDTLKGKILLQGAKFNIAIKGQHIMCDGKNIWTFIPEDNEVQVNYFEQSDDIFSPSKIFNLYREGYLYQVKEKRTEGGKSITVIEISPSNKKVSYFKIDVAIDAATLQITESKIYEKNGARYTYKLTKQSPNMATTEADFTFDAKKHPGVKVVDLR